MWLFSSGDLPFAVRYSLDFKGGLKEQENQDGYHQDGGNHQHGHASKTPATGIGPPIKAAKPSRRRGWRHRASWPRAHARSASSAHGASGAASSAHSGASCWSWHKHRSFLHTKNIYFFSIELFCERFKKKTEKKHTRRIKRRGLRGRIFRIREGTIKQGHPDYQAGVSL